MTLPTGTSASPATAALGALTARALTGAWRAAPPAPALTPGELQTVGPHLMATATGGLGWWAIKDDEALTGTAAGQALRETYRMQTLLTRLYELRLVKVLELVAALGVDPLLLKGWTVARAYPARGLRGCGDVDLVVPADAHERVQAALDERPRDEDWVDVDLEHRFLTTDATPLRLLDARAAHAELDGHRVRIADPADQLRLVCVHYLRAGGWQPRALCDIALLLETGPPGLDWDLVLGDPRHRQWVTIAAGLAAQLLGADLSATPLAGAAARVPPWVRQHVLQGFGTTARDHDEWLPPFRASLHPGTLASRLRARWPADGLEVVMHHRRLIPPRSPLATQCLDVAYRALALAVPVRMPRARRDGSPELAR